MASAPTLKIPARFYASIMLALHGRKTQRHRTSALTLYEALLAAPDSLQFERQSLRQLAINGIAALLESVGREIYTRRETEAGALLE